MSDLDFKAAERDGWEIPWPIRYADIAPYYDKVEAAHRRLRRRRRLRRAAGQQVPACPLPRRAAASVFLQKAAKAADPDRRRPARQHDAPAPRLPAVPLLRRTAARAATPRPSSTPPTTCCPRARDRKARDPVERRGRAHPGRRRRAARAACSTSTARRGAERQVLGAGRGAWGLELRGLDADPAELDVAAASRTASATARDVHRPLPVRADAGPRAGLPAAAVRHAATERRRHRRRARLHAALQPSAGPASATTCAASACQFWNTGSQTTGADVARTLSRASARRSRREVKKRFPALVSMHPFGEVLPYAGQPRHRRREPARPLRRAAA